jgi:hypothetical protein
MHLLCRNSWLTFCLIYLLLLFLCCIIFKFTYFFSLYSFFCSTRAWTQGLYLEPLHQPLFCDGIFQIGSWKLLLRGGLNLRSSWSLCPVQLGLQVSQQHLAFPHSWFLFCVFVHVIERTRVALGDSHLQIGQFSAWATPPIYFFSGCFGDGPSQSIAPLLSTAWTTGAQLISYSYTESHLVLVHNPCHMLLDGSHYLMKIFVSMFISALGVQCLCHVKSVQFCSCGSGDS